MAAHHVLQDTILLALLVCHATQVVLVALQINVNVELDTSCKMICAICAILHVKLASLILHVLLVCLEHLLEVFVVQVSVILVISEDV
jgi:hypothetical protein